jgi:hypothetical protein
MGTIIGFVIGYVLGTRAGQQGFEELKQAWATVSSSEETRELVSGLLSVLADLARQGRAMLAERLAPDERESPVRRVA